jgi:hypothetical protein
MAHDPARVADTKGWLAKWADDLKAAEQLLSDRRWRYMLKPKRRFSLIHNKPGIDVEGLAGDA